MRATLWGATSAVLVAGWTVVLVGQGPEVSKNTAAETIAVVGCVAEAPASAGAAANTASGSVGAGQRRYVLTKAAEATNVPRMTTTGTGQGAQSAPKTAIASQYRLSGPDSMLAPYIKHQVEITGTVDTSAASRSAAGATATANGPTLKVDSVHLLATSCA